MTVKKILVLHTGGTISMHEGENGGVETGVENPLTGVKLALPDVELTVENIFNLPSGAYWTRAYVATATTYFSGQASL